VIRFCHDDPYATQVEHASGRRDRCNAVTDEE
jgi:hypothetical protein